MTRRRLIELSPLDEALLLWHDAVAAWNFELGVSAPRLDPVRVRDAYNTAIAHHPLMSCFVERDARGRFSWISDSEADIGEIEVIDCPDDATFARLTVDQLERPLPLDRAPLVRAVIMRRPNEDVLSSASSHVLTDGLGMFRLVRSVGRNYRGEYDPPPAVDIATAHRVLDPAPSDGWAGLTKKWTSQLDLAANAVTPRSRLAPSGGSGTGVEATGRSLPAAPILDAGRAHGVSFGTYSMAALHVTVDRWNRARDAPCDRVGVSQPVNLRPDEWWDDGVVNLAAMTSVLSDPADRRDIASALARVRPQLESEERMDQARELVASAKMGRLIPFDLRRRAFAAAPQSQFDTCVLSNIRTVPDPPRFDDEHPTVISASIVPMPGVGLVLGLFTVLDELRFHVVYRRDTFDERGANEFVDEFVDTLTNG